MRLRRRPQAGGPALPAAQPYDGQNIVAGFAAASLRGRATWACWWHSLTWDETAETHFRDALAMNARMGAQPWLAHTQHQSAVDAAGHARDQDRSRAAALLDEAAQTAGELGMRTLLSRVVALRQTVIN
ncbi:MAG: hypothetical protein R2844_03160 [Caldilineales bacterium]